MLYIALVVIQYIAIMHQAPTKKKNVFDPNYIPILFQRHATTIRAISSRLKYFSENCHLLNKTI